MSNKLKNKLPALLTGIVITLAILAFSWDKIFSYFPIFPFLNNKIYDISLRFSSTKKFESNVVIIDIDEASLAQEGKWPWPRSRFADLITALQQNGVAVIAIDILLAEKDINAAKMLLDYAEKQTKPLPLAVNQYLHEEAMVLDNDKILANALAQGDSVLGVYFNNEQHENLGGLGSPLFIIPPNIKLAIPNLLSYTGIVPTILEKAKHTGFVNTNLDEDGVLRRAPMVIEYKSGLYPALALETTRLFLLQDKVVLDIRSSGNQDVLLGIKLGNIYIPTDNHGNMIIPYKGPAFSFPYISATSILQNKFNPQTLAGKIVIMGSSAIGIGDVHATPVQTSHYPGCEVHANIIDAILNQHFLSTPLWLVGLEKILLLVLGLGLSLLMLYASVSGLFLLIILGEVFIFLFEIWLRTRWQLILPNMLLPYAPILLLGIYNMGYGYFFETRYRNKLHDLYGQYVSNDHIDNMLDNPSQYTLEGRSKEMSVLFADVRNFTSISEQLDATNVRKFLNQLFTPLTEIVFKNNGTIDKYVGDMIMAFWNDPLDDSEHGQHAVKSAIEMVAKVNELAPLFSKQNLTDVKIGVGVNSGMMQVGDMGSEYRKAYTVLGDAVNLASRLESANKFYGTKILVSESAKMKCQNIVFRLIDKVRVKGKLDAVNIFEPLGFSSEITQKIQAELHEYEKALAEYYGKDFQKAEESFRNLVNLYPDQKIYAVYLVRTAEFLINPPPKDWTGIYTQTEKAPTG